MVTQEESRNQGQSIFINKNTGVGLDMEHGTRETGLCSYNRQGFVVRQRNRRGDNDK